MKKTICVAFLSAIVAVLFTVVTLTFLAGSFVGDYMVHFGLERGVGGNPENPPRAYALLIPPDQREFTRPDFSAEDWSLRSNDGFLLHATRFYPRQQTNRWIIIAHGYGCTESNSWYLAANFLAQGYNVLTPDFHASGKSEGRYLTLGYREGSELSEWAQKIARENPDAEIVLHGVSMGAAAVMMAAAREDLPHEVVACIEDSGYTSAYDLLAFQVEDSFGLPSFPVMNLLNWRCEKMTGFNLRDANPLDAVQHAKVPILFIHGTKDTLVPPFMCDKLYYSAKGPKALYISEGTTHAAASQQDRDHYFQEVNAFLQTYLR